MSFLHRRSRSASATRPQTPASASAHKAATQAFLSSRASQANLSASAAAQAIRTMSPPPVPVDQIQTKRMIQRQASSGSLSKSARGRGRGGLERQNSGGSMTERTFRTPSPSPSRPVSRSGPQAPPIPSIPQHFAPPSTAPLRKKKRASSQEAPPPRILSPPPTRPHNRGQSLDRYGSSEPPPPPPSTPRKNHVPQTNDLEQVDSRNSVNFSRPLSPRPQSPMAQSPIAPSPMLANGDRPRGNLNSNAMAAGISPAQAAGIQYDLAQTANQPVKKKKKKIAAGTVEGSHLHTGTMASKPVVTPFEHDHELKAQSPPPEPVKRKKKKSAVSGENTQSPTTESPRTDSDSDSNVERKRDKRTQRASGILQKQPSIVREDWEGEQEENSPPQFHQAEEHPVQEVQSPLQDRRSVNAANVSRRIEGPIVVPSTANQPLPPETHAIVANERLGESPASTNQLQVTEPQATRGTSLSPSRSTRFSDSLSSDLAAGRKHDPPPRSVSPAKPALKYASPARVGIDGQPRGSSVTPSESSEISTVPSVDIPAKRKKSVRVSFDAQPEIVGPPGNDQSEMGSPGKERKGWLGLGKSKSPMNTIPSNGDMEELMKPRPQLPSFGSVRGQKFKDMNDANMAQMPRSTSDTRPATVEAKPASQSATSSEASSIFTPNTSTGVSNDFAVGAILAQEAQRVQEKTSQQRSIEPLPPQVTSVEGVLSYSDEESEASEVEDMMPVAPAQVWHEPIVSTPQKAIPPSIVNQQVTALAQPVQPEVPILALSPPTPAEEHELRPLDQWLVEVPGGFPVSAESLARLDESNKTRSRRKDDINDSDQEASDNDSIYSDAAEDPSEMEGMGFGSIDAILESPSAPPPTRITSPPETPLAEISAPPQLAPTNSWEQTQARWSGIAQQTRQAPAQSLAGPEEPPTPTVSNMESAGQVATPPPASPAVYTPASQPVRTAQAVQAYALQPPPSQPKRKKKKSPAAMAAAASVPVAASHGLPDSPPQTRNTASSYPPVEQPSMGHAAAAAAPFRHSMRAASPPETEPGLRKTMRNESRKSMPAPAISQTQQRAAPAVTSSPSQSRATLQKKHIPLAQAAAVTAPLPRAKSAAQPVANDSDSESSFRKARRSRSTTDGGKYTMRRSMRGVPEPTMRGDARNGVRSVSPEGRRPLSPPTTSRSMKTSMRASMDSTPTLRGPPEARRSASLFGRQQRSTPALSGGFTAQNNRSRVLDSDDEEDEPRPSKFRSRFADDSDDDIDVPQFAPVRGIPRRNNDEESTDLDDSSDEDRVTPPTKATPKLQIPQNNVPAPGSSAEAFSPNSEKKRRLLGMFRSKKPKDESMSPVSESPQGPARTTTDTSKPSRLGFASTAERDRVIAQTRAKLEAAKDQQQPSGQQQGVGKLQRRQMPERVMSDSWPLPPPIADEKQRPTTSDGPPMRNGTTRLNQGSMRRPGPAGDVVGRGGKKKKFPMLRKVFGLTD